MDDLSMLFLKITTNQILITSLSAWIIALFLKGSILSFKRKKIKIGNFIGPGGMPSSHTTMVVALATAVGLKEGWHSALAAITIVFALIVMYDSSGIRFAAGQQAIALNRIMDELLRDRETFQKRLRESLGHNITEVIAGGILGLLIAALMYNFY